MTTPEIHISDVRTFKSCRRKWMFSSGLRRNLEPIVPYTPFFTGRAVHYCLQQMYRNHGDATQLLPSLDAFIAKETASWVQPLWDTELQMVEEQKELISGIFKHYILWRWVNRADPRMWYDQNLSFVSLEHSFNVALPGVKARLAGRFDGVVRDLHGEYWVWENKTARSIDELQKSLANDEQCGTYIYAARKLFNVPIAGVIYNIMRKKVPTTPQILKNGYLSQNHSIDTSAEWYQSTVDLTYPDMSQQDKLDNFGPFIEELRLDPKKRFFARMPVRRSAEEIDLLIHNLTATARDMLSKRLVEYPSPSVINCNWCLFREPCLALTRGDVQMADTILHDNYRTREAYEEEVEEINNEKVSD